MLERMDIPKGERQTAAELVFRDTKSTVQFIA